MGTRTKMTVVSLPVRKYRNPLEPLEPEDLLAMERTITALETVAGAIMAHEDCDKTDCHIYDEGVIKNCLLSRETLVDIVEGLRAYHDLTDDDDDDDDTAMHFIQRMVEAFVEQLDEKGGDAMFPTTQHFDA